MNPQLKHQRFLTFEMVSDKAVHYSDTACNLHALGHMTDNVLYFFTGVDSSEVDAIGG